MKDLMIVRFLFLLLLLLLTPCKSDTTTMDDDSAPMDKLEQEALYSVIRSFVGKWWKGEELYPDPCGWTPIQGVSCDLFDGQWYVTSLNIGPILENSLQCSDEAAFSPYIFKLRHLNSLSLFKCFNSPVDHPSTIPPANWGSLSETLEKLEFRSNTGLTREFPTAITKLTGLRSLVVMDNGINGTLPFELGKLVHLRKLVLSSNRFSGHVPISLGSSLPELLILDLSRNFLSGRLPPAIGNLSSLLKLDVSNNIINGPLPKEIGNLRHLTLLDVRNNNISGGGLAVGTISLHELLLSNNPLGWDMSSARAGAAFHSLRNIATIDLSNTKLTGQIPESIADLKNLRFLALNSNMLVGNVPSKLAGLPSITSMYLNGNNLSGALVFSPEFYGRMGKRFSAWGNPNLCYFNAAGPVIVPVGLKRCSEEKEARKKVGNGGGHHRREEDDSSSCSMICCSFFGFGSSYSSSIIHGFLFLILSLS